MGQKLFPKIQKVDRIKQKVGSEQGTDVVSTSSRQLHTPKNKLHLSNSPFCVGTYRRRVLTSAENARNSLQECKERGEVVP